MTDQHDASWALSYLKDDCTPTSGDQITAANVIGAIRMALGHGAPPERVRELFTHLRGGRPWTQPF